MIFSRKIIILALAGLTASYLLFWPVAVDPVDWDTLHSAGYVDDFTPNDLLTQAQEISLGEFSGPESVVVSPSGELYVSTYEGDILRSADHGQSFQSWVQTGGRPLGLALDGEGNLIVADAYRGLLRYAPNGVLLVLADTFEGAPLSYVNSVAVTSSGIIYFTDSSSKFGAQASGGTYPASLLDIMEHGGHGRLFRLDPNSLELTEIAHGFNFANGVAAISSDQEGIEQVFVVETGNYRVLSFDVKDLAVVAQSTLIENLPGFPDNLSLAPDGSLWLGLVSPRNRLLDRLSRFGWLRKIVQRLPAVFRPKATHYGMVVNLSAQGQVLRQLQDPSGRFFTTTGAIPSDDSLYVSRLLGDHLLRVSLKTSQ